MAEKEYIEREAVNALIKAECSPKVAAYLIDAVAAIPAADVRHVVKATWRRYSPFTDTYECSNCGEQVIDQQFRTNFCPNCGADMRQTGDEKCISSTICQERDSEN